jgi:hypothetical protein
MEEIIEINPITNKIIRYCVIVERAQFTLGDLLKIWNNVEERERRREWFTPEKLSFYFY